ncbi:hypothetical protein ERJ75_001408400 [Trypanosoma vivax]|nr:hypothetical protein ERJ75_001408400 [Trypanosoma vivax]
MPRVEGDGIKRKPAVTSARARKKILDGICVQLSALQNRKHDRKSGLEKKERDEFTTNNASLGIIGPGKGSVAPNTVVSAAPTTQYAPNTRRLPPIFAEHRQITVNIETVCNELKRDLVKLEARFSRRRCVKQGDSLEGSETHPLMRVVARAAAAKHKERMKEGLVMVTGGASEALGGASAEMVENYCSEVQHREDICRVRAAAADEGLRDDQSVVDYAGEPDVPLYVPNRTIRAEIEAMEDSLKKIGECVNTMFFIDEQDSGNQWWESAMMIREMKANSIRMNYHARNVLKWFIRAQEHFLIDAVMKNEYSERCRSDLLYMREQIALFSERIDRSKELQEKAKGEIAMLKEWICEATHFRSEMLEKLLEVAQSRHLLHPECKDVQRAELMLLLEHTTWPQTLQEDVERVKQWVRENVNPIDV